MSEEPKIVGYHYALATEPMTILYHKTDAPKGKAFPSSIAHGMEDKNGWVDSSAKFGVIGHKESNKPLEIVEKTVSNEKASFISSVKSGVALKEEIAFNEVFHQLSSKEVLALVKTLDPASAANAIQGSVGKEGMKEIVIALIQSHNETILEA